MKELRAMFDTTSYFDSEQITAILMVTAKCQSYSRYHCVEDNQPITTTAYIRLGLRDTINRIFVRLKADGQPAQYAARYQNQKKKEKNN